MDWNDQQVDKKHHVARCLREFVFTELLSDNEWPAFLSLRLSNSNAVRPVCVLRSDPQFVGSFDIDEYVFFFFRENAIEHAGCGKMVYSRVARVCKVTFDRQTQLMFIASWKRALETMFYSISAITWLVYHLANIVDTLIKWNGNSIFLEKLSCIDNNLCLNIIWISCQ